MGETYDQPESEWYTSEKERFVNEYDRDRDGFLVGEEINAWLIPDMKQTAAIEAEHLFKLADTDNVIFCLFTASHAHSIVIFQDGQLQISEIVDAYKSFVGSEATNYGEKLLDLHDEL